VKMLRWLIGVGASLIAGFAQAEVPQEFDLVEVQISEPVEIESFETLAMPPADALEIPSASTSKTETDCDSPSMASCHCDCVRSRCRCRYHWLASVDYLNWTPRRGGWDLAIRDPNSDNNIEGPVESLELENSSGVRASIGYLLGSGWDAGFRYTGFESDRRQTVLAADAGQLWLTRANPGSFNNAADAVDARAEVDLDIYDIEAGYWVRQCRSVKFRGFGGVRLASLDQAFDASYTGGTVALPQRTYRQRTDLSAYGLRAGSEANWLLPRGLTLSGTLAGSLLIGDFQTSYLEQEAGFQSAGDVQLTDNYFEMVPVLEVQLGIAKRLGRCTLETGYEASAWFSADRRYNFTGAETINRGTMTNVPRDIGFDGFYLRMTLLR